MSSNANTRLPIRPRPNAREESLSNYCLRVSEANEYRTPKMMLALAGISDRIHVGIDGIDRLGTLLDVDPAVLQEMAYVRKSGEKDGNWQRARHHYRPHEVTPRFTRVCPACVKELGYTRAVWDLRLVVSCHKHKTWLRDSCPGCGKALTWVRRGLLICSCGNRLDEDGLTLAPEGCVRVSSLIEHALSGKRHVNTDLSWCPQEVMDLPVSELLPFLTYWVTISARLVAQSLDEILAFRTSFNAAKLSAVLDSVGHAVAEWPMSHSRIIAKLFERHSHFENSVRRNDFRDALGQSWCWAQSDLAPSMLRDGITAYLAEREVSQVGRQVRFLHPRHIIPFTGSGPGKRSISLLQGTELLGISERLFFKLCARGMIKKLEKRPNCFSAIFDLASVLAIKPLILTTCDYRDAAKKLVVSGAQLSSLVTHGILEVAIGKKKSALGARFRIDDIAALNARFAELSRTTDESSISHGLKLSAFWPKRPCPTKNRAFGSLVQEVLKGKIAIASSQTGVQGIGDYYVDISGLALAGFSIHRRWLPEASSWPRCSVTGRFLSKAADRLQEAPW